MGVLIQLNCFKIVAAHVHTTAEESFGAQELLPVP